METHSNLLTGKLQEPRQGRRASHFPASSLSMARAPRSPTEKRTRQRIAAHLRQQWEAYLASTPDQALRLQRAFADLLGLHEATVSKILKGTTDEAGLDIAIALNTQLHINGEFLLAHDPPTRFFTGTPIDGRIRRREATIPASPARELSGAIRRK